MSKKKHLWKCLSEHCQHIWVKDKPYVKPAPCDIPKTVLARAAHRPPDPPACPVCERKELESEVFCKEDKKLVRIYEQGLANGRVLESRDRRRLAGWKNLGSNFR